MALGVEELDPVVLGRVVRGGEDDAEILREQGNGGSRQHSPDDGDPAPGDDALDDSRFERRARAARVTADEDAAATRPDRGGTPEPLDEIEA